MSAKISRLTEILKDLEKNSEVTGVALVSKKGQLMCASLHKDADEKAISAMSAAMVSVGTRVGQVLDAGVTSSIVINASQSIVILNQLGSAVLISTAPSDAKIGLIDFEISSAIEQIDGIL